MSITRLCAMGHIASSHDLIARGASRGQLARAVSSGRLIRLRKGVYACPHIGKLTEFAARLGAALTCVSVLRAAGVWAGESRLVHLQVPPNSSDRRAVGAHIHWGQPRFAMTSPWEAGRMESMWQAIRCLDEENAIAALESAMHLRYLSSHEIAEIVSIAPARLGDGLRRMIPNSGSGLETIARLRIERAGHVVSAQAHVPGLGHQDLLVDECLAVEIDGEEWHGTDQFHADRDRDLQSALLGRRTIRLTARHIRNEWPYALTAIERAVDESRCPHSRGESDESRQLHPR